MIRLTCNCGRRLRARDEAALRRAVCPSCGCPVGRSSTLEAGTSLRPKPLTLNETEAPGNGFSVVPLWKEGLASAETLPRYQLVTSEDATALVGSSTDGSDGIGSVSAATGRLRRKTRRYAGPLRTDRKETLLFGFRCWRSIILLSLFLGAALGAGLLILDKVHLEPAPLTLLLALVPPIAALIGCSGFWLVAFTATARGEDSIVVRHSSFVRELLLHVMRSLVCFGTVPVWILALAGYFWLHAGELAVVDIVILAELVLVAFLYWWLTLLAVSMDGSLGSMTPNGIFAALRRLGTKTSLVAAAAVVLALVLIGVPAGYAFVSVPQNGGHLVTLLPCCVAAQVFLAYLARGLGVSCYLARRTQPSEKVAAVD